MGNCPHCHDGLVITQIISGRPWYATCVNCGFFAEPAGYAPIPLLGARAENELEILHGMPEKPVARSPVCMDCGRPHTRKANAKRCVECSVEANRV